MAVAFLQSFSPLAIFHSSSSRKPQNRLTFNFHGACSVRRISHLQVLPVNPNDSFIHELSSISESSFKSVLNDSDNSWTLPNIDLFDSPKSMSFPSEAESGTIDEIEMQSPPPDLPSQLLHGRIIYVGMPLVPAVTELVIAELMYLQFLDPKAPIYMYINSTGTTREDNETVGMETDGFAIYDAMMLVENEVHTVAVGVAVGQACLLLAAGTKGKRFMLPHAKAMIQQPRSPPFGDMRATDVLIRAREVVKDRDTLSKLLAEHTGNTVEAVSSAMKRPFYMDATKAMEFGVIDKVLWRGQEDIIADVPDMD